MNTKLEREMMNNEGIYLNTDSRNQLNYNHGGCKDSKKLEGYQSGFNSRLDFSELKDNVDVIDSGKDARDKDEAMREEARRFPIRYVENLIEENGYDDLIKVSSGNPYMEAFKDKVNQIWNERVTYIDLVRDYGLEGAVEIAMSNPHMTGTLDDLMEYDEYLIELAREYPVEDYKYLIKTMGLDGAIDFASKNPYMRKSLKKLMKKLDKCEADSTTYTDMIETHGLFEAIKIAESNRFMGSILDSLKEEDHRMKCEANENPVSEIDNYVDRCMGVYQAIDKAIKNPYMGELLDELKSRASELEECWNYSTDRLIEKFGLDKAIEVAKSNRYMKSQLDELLDMSESEDDECSSVVEFTEDHDFYEISRCEVVDVYSGDINLAIEHCQKMLAQSLEERGYITGYGGVLDELLFQRQLAIVA